MKKLTLLVVSLLGLSNVNAQNKISIAAQNPQPAKVKLYPNLATANDNAAYKNVNPSVLTTIFSEDFASGLPATWAQTDSAGNGEIWTYTTAGPLNAIPAAVLASATAANGWMMFDDDGYGNNQTIASASLITPAFDCSGKPQVFLSLQEEFVSYPGAEGVIYVSNDSINWTAVHNVADFASATTGATTNPYVPTIDISAVAANQSTVYLKFTYRGDWSYWWQMDNILVYEPTGVDVAAVSVNPLNAEYTLIPLAQSGNMVLSGTVANYGATATNSGTALFEVVDSTSNAVVFSQTVNLPTIASLATATINTTNTPTFTAASSYKVRITLAIAGDGNPLNDVMESTPTEITDSVYARDNGVVIAGFYNGPGVANAITGQNFILNTIAQVTSISIYANPAQNFTGTFPLSMSIHNQTAGSTPTTLPFATTDTIIIQPGSISASGEWITLPISTFSVTLTPGLYFFGINQDDPDFQFGGCPSIFTLGTTWATWNTIPSPPAVNGWANLEDFNLNFTVMIRPNFGDVTAGINTLTSLSGFDVFPNPSNGIINVSNSNTNGAAYTVSVYNAIGQSVYETKNTAAALTTIDLSALPAGVYHVKVRNNSGSFDKAVVLSNK